MQKRGFKGIWIPKEIWLNEDLSVMEKLFLVEIDSLDNEDGCFASNKHFSEFFGLSKGRCTQIIKSLEEKELVRITYEKDGKQIKKRIIKVVNKINGVVNKLNRGSKKTKQGYLENDDESNTKSSNTKSSNTSNKESKSDSSESDNIPYQSIIEYLNDKTGSQYRHTTKGTQTLIRARWNEGFKHEDFIKVIDVKTSDWINDAKMKEYLRPQTLFGTKFESYLNQSLVNNHETRGGGEYDDLF